MNRELEIQFQERAINTLLREMDGIFHLLRDPDSYPFVDPDFSPKEIVAEKKREFEDYAERLYNMSVVYFELKNLSIYIKKFDEKILPLYENKEQLATISVSNIYDDEQSKLTQTYRQLLFPFRAFGGGEEKHLTRLDILENILENTAFILNNKGVKPSREFDVYDNVKIVCEATFPKEAQFDGGDHPFYKLAKCYKPDILIPFLNCAVEYKFAATEKQLNKTIDQILEDVKGYSQHEVYKFFYAVFYVKTGIIQKKRFSEMWRSKGFPENWKEILVEGEIR